MANLVPAIQSADNQLLTKPIDWAVHMVTAAVKFSSGNDTLTSYTTPDQGRIDILNTLNWYEAHNEYQWPDFTTMGFDFSQAMRFRRALVNDVFLALQKAGNITISSGAGVLGTPDSTIVRRGTKRADTSASKCLTERKRMCKRGNESDTEVATDDEGRPSWDDEGLLAASMRVLLDTAGVDVTDDLKGEKDALALAGIVHDHLVGVWDGPQAGDGRVPAELEKEKTVKVRAKDKGEASRRSSPELGVDFGRTNRVRPATMGPVRQ